MRLRDFAERAGELPCEIRPNASIRLIYLPYRGGLVIRSTRGSATSRDVRVRNILRRITSNNRRLPLALPVRGRVLPLTLHYPEIINSYPSSARCRPLKSVTLVIRSVNDIRIARLESRRARARARAYAS